MNEILVSIEPVVPQLRLALVDPQDITLSLAPFLSSDSTSGVVSHAPAGETISAMRVVYERLGNIYLLDPSDPSAVDLRLGLSTTAGDLGQDISVQVLGTFDQVYWAWGEGLLFLGPNGTLTQVAPTTGWLLVVGFASSPTRITLNFGTPVLLA